MSEESVTEDEAAESVFGEGEGPIEPHPDISIAASASVESKSSSMGEAEMYPEEYGELFFPSKLKAEGEAEGESEAETVSEGSGEEESAEEEEESIPEDKPSLDSEYLKKVLGVPLTFALLEITSRRPTDPIHYLGHYLLKWRHNRENKEKYEHEIKSLMAEREAYVQKKLDRERQEMLLKQQKEEEKLRKEKKESSYGDDEEKSEIAGEAGEEMEMNDA